MSEKMSVDEYRASMNPADYDLYIDADIIGKRFILTCGKDKTSVNIAESATDEDLKTSLLTIAQLLVRMVEELNNGEKE